MNFSNKTYDTLKWITTIVLPALGTLYFALSGIWGFPYGEQIVGTITAIVTFLGVILGISNYNYNKLEDGVQDTFNADSFTEMMGVDENEDENDSAEE
jgi:hypothetical protein